MHQAEVPILCPIIAYLMQSDYIPILSNQLGISSNQVIATIKLIHGGATTPFIARYRKDLTQGLDEVLIESIRTLLTKFTELIQRKQTILDTIQKQGKLTPSLEKLILDTWESNVLEDLYLPYKPKRKTKATLAREKGLEPLALWILNEYQADPALEAKKYLQLGIDTVDDALQGARDIIADIINDHALVRSAIRHLFEKHAVLYSKMVKGKGSEGDKYKDYYIYEEKLNRCPSHRLLAMFRGEDEGYLKLSIESDEDLAIQKLEYIIIKKNNACSGLLRQSIKDAYKRLLAPAMETEYRNLYKSKADDDAIKVFAENLKQLLLAPPLGSKRILAIDPGFRSGCKLTCLNEEGMLLTDAVIYPHEPQRASLQAADKINYLLEQYAIEAIAIGNGTAGRETETWIRSIPMKRTIDIYMVNENGASIYSASAIAREEFPDKDVTVRGSVSIGRRLADPLAELIKIDAKSIGVGQYQHDVDQTKLKQSLDVVVEHCVHQVGINLNTASKSLLTYVSGLNEKTAQHIIEFRTKNGAFTSRQQLKKVLRLGDKAFEQCAAFLRIPQAKNVLDNSAVHPESYFIVERMAQSLSCSIQDLISNDQIRKSINPETFVHEYAGILTIRDILIELEKPNRDPRASIKPFVFSDVKNVEHLTVGMTLPGIVTNITKFGCFVDIGVKQDGMVHISQLADKYVADPNAIVKLQQQVMVKVLEVDLTRKRISLSMKGF